ncbi:Lipoprotein LpqB OS=Tsukamurella paurometabola (strain ATCC 8368 / DSM / CCUG 35730 / CIP 100753/ JCM 10117 / KCTC 9821 / NBRC 16120 / NCIMB 702349 / NCTC 13040) OX=521096 GN=lpqB PE=3 SV=1 [Tsukamurella paurometabola]|uniref:Lipoprotein LpqB n=1 Tax=Tsukamurella paurometabola (strain ATCC 8368 / DSM 20162 / CCUG 35730 / CIP 100753 / JCM 10117 / KCTC 9821 / NBRC 16120 / NCIMB 702349 / NCTC 13040) TaxID=521096 RepID=D5UVC0_TSUPD|nr:MtrAB system accessory lipoprotein LpqB [Tsukamurella paurometabola]ADG77710.1 Lipoprotein LpqB, beta-propeller domain-like protein [Tsukamurella paurometabola DSM 20162]SUP28410.1 lipoprotein LpqB [Tsukamurella paurometabola]
MRESRIMRLLAAVLAVSLVVSGCATIPESSNPRVIGDLGAQQAVDRNITPRKDAAPEAIVRDFLKANAMADNNYAASRKFLVPAAAWQVPQQAVVVKNIDVLPTERTTDLIKATIRAQATGFLGPDGTFEPTTQSITQNVQLVQTDGQWRIQGISSVGETPMLVIDTEQFRSVYNRYLLYFPDPTGRTLVPDARWLASPRAKLPADLLMLLVRGPRSSLVGAVFNPFGNTAAVRGPITDAQGAQRDPGVGYAGVRVDFTGLPRMDPDVGRLLAGQVVWTLAGADVQGPYVITVDGTAIDDKHQAGWNPNDVASSSPNASSDLAVGLHGVLDGRFVKVSGAAVTPVAGPLGESTAIRSVGLSASGRQVAAVLDSGPRGGPGTSLTIGPYGGVPTQVLSAGAMTRPTWMPDDATVWTVLDGNRVVRLRQDQTTGEVTSSDVDSAEVAAAAPGPITELRLARDGVRVALIAGGKALVGVVLTKPDGQSMISRLQQVVTDRDLAPSSIDWQTGDAFVVGRSTTESPVLTVHYDYGESLAVPSRNLSPPVSMVAASTSRVYATDSSGVWSIGVGTDSGAQYWSQVDRLAGGRANPVLPG